VGHESLTRIELFTDALLLEEHLSEEQKRRHTQTARDEMRKEIKRPQKLAEEIVEPVNIVTNYIINLKVGADDIVRRRETEVVCTDALIGFGRPPWLEDGVFDVPLRCCCPRLVALTLKRLCCFRFCMTEPLEKALRYYPPKRVRFFCIWFQIVSKLHERQIQGLFFSILLAAVYFWRVYHTILCGCQGSFFSGTFWGCATEEFKKSVMLLGLLVHIPATFICLLRIRNLDAIIRIMEDIRKLQNLRSIILDFEKTLVADERRQELLDSATKRVLTRVKLFVDSFRFSCRSLDQPKTPKPRQDYLRKRIEAVNHFFSFAEVTLGDADKWLRKNKQQKDSLIEKVEEKGQQLSRDQWTLVTHNGDSDPEEDGQRTPPFTPSNHSSFAGDHV